MDPKEDLEDYLTYLPRYGIAGAIVIVAWFLIQAVKEAKKWKSSHEKNTLLVRMARLGFTIFCRFSEHI
jgi:O-antigen ligase